MSKDNFIELLNDNTEAIIDWYEKVKTTGTSDISDLEKIWNSRDKLIEQYTGRDMKGHFLKKDQS